MRQARGLMLIEVVAALLILATTATALITAQARSLDQWRVQRDRVRASILAEEWFVRWPKPRTASAIPWEGDFENASGWRWTREVETFSEERGFEVWTLVIHRGKHGGAAVRVASYSWLEPIHEARPTR